MYAVPLTYEIKKQMLLKGFSFKDLSKESTVSYSTIRNVVLYGHSPRTTTAYKIADALNCETTDLFSLEVKEA